MPSLFNPDFQDFLSALDGKEVDYMLLSFMAIKGLLQIWMFG